MVERVDLPFVLARNETGQEDQAQGKKGQSRENEPDGTAVRVYREEPTDADPIFWPRGTPPDDRKIDARADEGESNDLRKSQAACKEPLEHLVVVPPFFRVLRNKKAAARCGFPLRTVLASTQFSLFNRGYRPELVSAS